MALQKTPVNIPFAQGLDTKTDSKQVQMGKFVALNNSVFDKLGQLTKRNGYKAITNLPNTIQTNLTTLNGNLLATGTNLYAFNSNSNQWLNQGIIQPVQLETLPIIRNSSSQSGQDMAINSGGLACVTYTDSGNAYYNVVDSNTGYQIVSRVALESTAANPRVFLLNQYFVITYLLASSLKFVIVPASNPTSPTTPRVFSSSVSGINAGYDGLVAYNTLYLCWAGSAGNTLIGYMDSGINLSAPLTVSATHAATKVSISMDLANRVLYASFYDGTTIRTAIYNNQLAIILAATAVDTVSINNLTSYANNSVNTIVYEVANSYGFTPSSGSVVATNYLSKSTITQTGTVTDLGVFLRSVGLASKATFDGAKIYVLATFSETNQNTYFLIDTSGNVYMRLAATNGGGYITSQVLPQINTINNNYQISYLNADALVVANKGTNLASGTPVNAIYAQYGINLATFTLNASAQHSSEIAGALHLTGGQLWEFDGVTPVEHGFQVFPSPNSATTVNNGAIKTNASGGSITAQQYFYQFTYEWSDNQGNIHRSAPSIPISITTTGSTSTNTIYVPTLRLTYKLSPNPVRIVGYRWSVAQETYYQFTSITSPTLNDTTVDYVTITDTYADSAILGNPILYTTGSVVENTAAPASIASALYKNRLFLIDAEDRNLLWYSKQVIEATPVEMSDLFTLYVAPTSGAQGSTGPMTAISAMDDKFIIFKQDAIYYMTGNGPDNTGANNDFSDPVFITSSVGCNNPSSIVLTPSGLMFQSDKGIWLLGRDLQTNYIGAAVEKYNTNTVVSALSIPATNQVRFILDNNVTLMYDYFVGQWGTHSNIFAISATLYQGVHTYLNSYGKVLQETPGVYLDDSVPVLLSFTTSWLNIAGLQGYERFYFMYLLGTYLSPFKLNVQIAYDYNISSTQNILITPDNYSAAWGGDSVWGGSSPWGGPSNVFEARIFPQNQKCESFQITINELYDPSLGVSAGAGLTLSGLNLVIGAKKGYRTQKAGRSFG